jgi:GT2 family glycosyltransferase
MVSIAAVVVGVDLWEKYTLPCVKSLEAVAPTCDVYVVDAGSRYPYPKGENYTLVRMDEAKSYAQAINVGLKADELKHDWYLITNNDTIYHKPFAQKVQQFKQDTIYGFHIFNIRQRLYISSFAFFLSRTAIEKVGYFDERFIPYGYEDADYCWRAQDLGFKLRAYRRDVFGLEHLYDKDKPAYYPEAGKELWEKYELSGRYDGHSSSGR